jgi:hypothetical protein
MNDFEDRKARIDALLIDYEEAVRLARSFILRRKDDGHSGESLAARVDPGLDPVAQPDRRG